MVYRDMVDCDEMQSEQTREQTRAARRRTSRHLDSSRGGRHRVDASQFSSERRQYHRRGKHRAADKRVGRHLEPGTAFDDALNEVLNALRVRTKTVSRRSALSGALMATLVGFATPSLADGVLPNPLLRDARDVFTAEVRPVTDDRVSVVVRLGRAVPNAVLRVSCGSRTVTAGFADRVCVVGIEVPRSARSTLRVSVSGGNVHQVGADTRPEPLRHSLHRVVNKRIAATKQDDASSLIVAHGVSVASRLRDPLGDLLRAASEAKAPLSVISGFRSFDGQASLYNAYRSRDGQDAADRFSARAGHSEHQLGLAIDVGAASGEAQLRSRFAQTPAGRWLAEHAHEYGFIVRYPEGKEDITGYLPEPWHLRYVGEDTARYLHDMPGEPKTLEELFGLPAAPGYDT